LSNGRGLFLWRPPRSLPISERAPLVRSSTTRPRTRDRRFWNRNTKRRFKAPPGESGARRATASRHDQPPRLGSGEAPVGQPLCRGLLCRAKGAPPKRG
jgi:hypothetical protein